MIYTIFSSTISSLNRHLQFFFKKNRRSLPLVKTDCPKIIYFLLFQKSATLEAAKMKLIPEIETLQKFKLQI